MPVVGAAVVGAAVVGAAVVGAAVVGAAVVGAAVVGAGAVGDLCEDRPPLPRGAVRFRLRVPIASAA